MKATLLQVAWIVGLSIVAGVLITWLFPDSILVRLISCVAAGLAIGRTGPYFWNKE